MPANILQQYIFQCLYNILSQICNNINLQNSSKFVFLYPMITCVIYHFYFLTFIIIFIYSKASGIILKQSFFCFLNISKLNSSQCKKLKFVLWIWLCHWSAYGLWDLIHALTEWNHPLIYYNSACDNCSECAKTD